MYLVDQNQKYRYTAHPEKPLLFIQSNDSTYLEVRLERWGTRKSKMYYEETKSLSYKNNLYNSPIEMSIIIV
jgi:hypothetical protein